MTLPPLIIPNSVRPYVRPVGDLLHAKAPIQGGGGILAYDEVAPSLQGDVQEGGVGQTADAATFV